MNKFSKLATCLLTLIVFQSNIHAEEITLKYPELHVTPRASERLKMEAKDERNLGHRFKNQAPALSSSLMTLITAAYLSSKGSHSTEPNRVKEFDDSVKVGYLVGGAWLGILTYMSSSYTPYYDGFRDIAKMPTKTKRDQLTRERMAEESIYRAETTARKIALLSTISNFIASALMASNGNENTAIMGGLSAVASFAPYFFKSNWITIAERHREYKKKIYGPVSMSPWMSLDKKGELISGVQWAYQF